MWKLTKEEQEWLERFNMFYYYGSKQALDDICDDDELKKKLLKKHENKHNSRRRDVWANYKKTGTYDTIRDEAFVSAVQGYCPRCETDQENCTCVAKKGANKNYSIRDYGGSVYPSPDTYVKSERQMTEQYQQYFTNFTTHPNPYPPLSVTEGYIDDENHAAHGCLVSILGYRELTGEHLCIIKQGRTPRETRKWEYIRIYLNSRKIRPKNEERR